MTKSFVFRHPVSRWLVASIALFAAVPSGLAATLFWDPNLTNSNAGGTGTWNLTTPANWYNGASDVGWTAGNDAVFGGASGTVSIVNQGVAPNSITFNTGGYLLQSSSATTRVVPVGDLTVDTTGSANHAAINIGVTGAGVTLDLASTTRTISVASGDQLIFNFGLRGSGGAGFTKTGLGMVTLFAPSASLVNGTVTISAGTVQLAASTALANTGALAVTGGTLDLQTFNQTRGSVQLAGGSIIGTGTLTSASAFDAQSGSVSAKLAGSGVGLNKTTAGTVTLSGVNTYTGVTSVGGGSLQLGVSSAIAASGTLTVSGGTFDLQTFSQTLAGVQLTGGTIAGTTGVLTSTSTYDLQSGSVSAILAGSVGVTKTTAGTVTLSGTNTYTGVNALNGGILNVTKDLALGAAPAAAATNITMDGGTLQFGAAFNINANRSIVLNAGGGTIDTNSNSPTVAITNAISGGGSFTKAGAGTLTFGSQKTYTGGTIVTGGTLQFGATNYLPATGDVTVNGGTLDVRTQTQTVGGNATLISGTIGATTGILKANSFDVRSGTVNAKLQDNAAGATLTKSTGGTVILNAANTYTGATAINGGMLTLGAGGSISGATTINNTGTLGGIGTVAALTINTGGIVSPGTGVGTLTAAATTFGSGGRYQFELMSDGSGVAGTNFDKLTLGNLNVAGLSSSGTFILGLQTLTAGGANGPLAAFDPGVNHTWASIVTTSGLTGAFASNLITVDPTGFANAYNGTFNVVQNGNNFDLQYTVIPEPGTWALTLGSLGALVLVWKSRRRSLPI